MFYLTSWIDLHFHCSDETEDCQFAVNEDRGEIRGHNTHLCQPAIGIVPLQSPQTLGFQVRLEVTVEILAPADSIDVDHFRFLIWLVRQKIQRSHVPQLVDRNACEVAVLRLCCFGVLPILMTQG